MQGLGPAQDRGQGFQGCPDNVIVRVLLSKAPSGCLHVRSQHGGFWIFRVERTDQFVPQEAGRPEHGNFHEKIHAHSEKEREPGREVVDIEPGREGRPDILQAVRQGERGLQHGIGPGFHHVVAADAHRVVPGHIPGTVADNVRNNAHGRLRRINIGIAGEVLFEDVILDGARELFGFEALLFGSDNIPRQDRQDAAVHGHGHTHLVQGNLVKKDLHILHGVNRDPGLPDIAHNPDMVGVIAPVRCQVKSHRESFLPGRQVAPVKRVGFLGG